MPSPDSPAPIRPPTAATATATASAVQPAQPALRKHFAFNLIDACFGPVFQRDIRITSRKPGTYWARFAIAILLLAVATIALITTVFFDSIHNSIDRLERLQNLAPSLAIAILVAQFILLNLTAPILTAPAVLDERLKRTASTLAMTPLPALHIIASKLSSRILLLLILALLPTPILLGFRIFGGIEAAPLLQASSVIFSSALMGGSIALFFSTRFSKPASAVATTISTLALFSAFPLIVFFVQYQLLGNFNFAPRPAAWSFVPSPVMALSATISTYVGGTPRGAGFFASLWYSNSIFNLCVSALFIALATLSLPAFFRRDAVNEHTDKPARKARKAPEASANSANAAATNSPADPFALPAPNANHADHRAADSRAASSRLNTSSLSRTVGDNPVLWREMRQSFVSSNKLTRIFTALGFCFLVFLYIWIGPSDEGLGPSVAVILILLAAVNALGAGTNAIVGEVEARTFSTLLTTPISPSTILFAKALGALRRQWFYPTLIAIHLLIVTLFGRFHPASILFVTLPVLGLIFFITCSGVFMSLVSKKSSTASSYNLITFAILWILAPIASIFLLESLNISPRAIREPLALLYLLICGPATAILEVTAFARDSLRNINVPVFGRGLSAAVALSILCTLTQVLAGLLFIFLARTNFNRYALRAA
jgi:ABC-type transport system involved in multi-copper enzyme maturation permease subunit